MTDTQIKFMVNRIYAKDISLESPESPGIFNELKLQPKVGFNLNTNVQKYVGASLAGFTLYIFSIYSAIYGIILFDESLLGFHYYGAALVFFGVYLARKIVK